MPDPAVLPSLTPGMFLVVCPLVFLAAFMDAIAGGGGLISIQAYLLTGLPIHFVLGTNKLSSVMGAAVTAGRYYRHRLVDMGLCVPSIGAALAGSALGSALTLLVPEGPLQWVLLGILPVTAFFVLRNKRSFQDEAPPTPIPRRRALAASIIVSFIIGGYDGFFGPGTGTFLILLYTGIVHLESRIAGGNAKFVNLASNLAAVTVFLVNHQVLLPLGLCAGVFSIAGGYLGSGMVIHKGSAVIRVGILVILALLFVKTAYDVLVA